MIHVQRSCQARRDIDAVCPKELMNKATERGDFSEERVRTVSRQLCPGLREMPRLS